VQKNQKASFFFHFEKINDQNEKMIFHWTNLSM